MKYKIFREFRWLGRAVTNGYLFGVRSVQKNTTHNGGDDIAVEGTSSNLKFIWSDAKLGNGALSKNQEMLIKMIKTGNFEVDVVRSGKILIDGINLTKITFDQINIVTSISKDIAGTITKVWP